MSSPFRCVESQLVFSLIYAGHIHEVSTASHCQILSCLQTYGHDFLHLSAAEGSERTCLFSL